MSTRVHLGGEQAFRLTDVLCVYGDGQRSFVARHAPLPAPNGGAPVLGPGELLGTPFLRGLAKQLGRRERLDVLPPQVLARTSEATVWWRPASHAVTFYVASLGDLALSVSGRLVPHPPLVFRATETALSVRALAADERPTRETKLFAAPYYNVNQAGGVCLGSMRLPTAAGVDALTEWERGFFESEFTHPIPGAVLTRHPGGFAGLWCELAELVTAAQVASEALPTFPAEWLQRAGNQTLGAFVTRGDDDERGDA